MIEQFANTIKSHKDDLEKIRFLNAQGQVANSSWRKRVERLTGKEELAMKQLLAIGQMPKEDLSDEAFETLVQQLVAVDAFYREMGGIIGYQAEVLRLIHRQKEAPDSASLYRSPTFIDISQKTPEVLEAVEQGICALPELCEIYPLGGAADRLHLVDEKTGCELPAAKLEFAGCTLLERLFLDLAAREQLYFERTGKKVVVPVAIMTSHEKQNHRYVLEILERCNWFSRPKERFKLFTQPLVPAVNEKGNWLFSESGKLMLKPGGHGAIWKQALSCGVFEFFDSFGAKFALVRQINNPIAGLDDGLLAFTGIGFKQKMSFGFASCPRLIGAAEGVNVLIERKKGNRYDQSLSSIEYCDFTKFGIQDAPLESGSPYSRFTSNTNILFANLADLKQAIARCPYPGLLMNLKKTPGKEEAIGRLELTMQNIADAFVESSEKPLKSLQHVFVTYNARHKTISTAKKVLGSSGHSFNETPENCFYDLLRAHRELLEEFCGFHLPPEKKIEEVLASHPSFVFLFHPFLGPQFQSIGQKLRGGSLKEGSELRLELSQVDIEGLELDGSLRILATDPLRAKCKLRNVKVENRGVDWERSKPFWKGRYERRESLTIVLEGDAEFIAEDLVFHGDRQIVVKPTGG